MTTSLCCPTTCYIVYRHFEEYRKCFPNGKRLNNDPIHCQVLLERLTELPGIEGVPPCFVGNAILDTFLGGGAQDSLAANKNSDFLSP